MPGPAPKDPAIRRRRNQTATRAVLKVETRVRLRAPRLPKRGEDGKGEWHELTRAWWRDVWASPMAAEFVQADVHALFILATLVDDFWRGPTREMAAEIRLQRQCFGLTPIDRRRLQWEVERVEEATTRKQKRARVDAPIEDPRSVLKLVGGSK